MRDEVTILREQRSQDGHELRCADVAQLDYLRCEIVGACSVSRARRMGAPIGEASTNSKVLLGDEEGLSIAT